MKILDRRRAAGVFTAWMLLGALTACGAGAPPPAEPATAPAPTAAAKSDAPSLVPDPPRIHTLRTGTLTAHSVGGVIRAEVLESTVLGEFEVLRVALPDDWSRQAAERLETGLLTWVTVEGSPEQLAWIRSDPKALEKKPELWLRRPKDATGPVRVSVYFSPSYNTGESGVRLVFEVDPAARAPAKPGFTQRWAQALADHLMTRRELPFADFSIDRLAGVGARVQPNLDTSWERAAEWSGLMELTTGVRSVRSAVQSRSKLRSEIDRFRPSVALSKLQGPQIRRHPWEAMLRLLNKPVPREPLAAAAPSDFYYVRSNELRSLFSLLDEVDAWGTPLVHLMEGQTDQYQIAERYRTEVALPENELSRLFGPEVIRQMALVGSDPFLRQGSDLTLIFQVQNRALFLAGIERNLAQASSGRGALMRTTADHHGVSFTRALSPDGAVRRHHATHKGFELISNSEGALCKVLDALDARTPALAAELDFKYMLARDGEQPAQLLAYAGDAFIEAALSPRSRILDARRQVALAELQRPAYAALLFGWFNGRAPETTAELSASRLMLASDLKHFDREPIKFVPGSAPRSAWGTPRSLTPLIERSSPTLVTTAEQAAYAGFVSQYEGLWSETLDPIALRVNITQQGDQTAIASKLRILPLLQDRDYRAIAELTGNVKLEPGKIRPGARVLFAIAPESDLRRDLTRSSRGILGKELKLDWLGDYGMVGVLDRPELANALARSGHAPELRSPDARQRNNEVEVLNQLPVYAALAVKSRAAAALVLTLLRTQFGGGMAAFETHKSYRGVNIVAVNVEQAITLYYALSERGFYIAFQPWVLEQLLDDEQEGLFPTRLPPPAAPARHDGAGQFILDFDAAKNGGLATALLWLFESESARGSPGNAEMLLLGAPKVQTRSAAYDQLSLDYFGAIPLTVDGKRFTLSASGLRDPARGTLAEPSWPALPVAGSAAERVLSAVARLRAQVGFDNEPSTPEAPNQRSLNASIEVLRR